MTVHGGAREMLPTTALFRPDRTAWYRTEEHRVWRHHVAKENLAEMNLLCNRLAAQGAQHEEETSFLRSSAGNQGGWEQARTQPCMHTHMHAHDS